MEKKEQIFFHHISAKVNRTIYAITLAMRRSDTPLYAKIAAGVCVFYALSPIDLIPDFIPCWVMWMTLSFFPYCHGSPSGSSRRR